MAKNDRTTSQAGSTLGDQIKDKILAAAADPTADSPTTDAIIESMVKEQENLLADRKVTGYGDCVCSVADGRVLEKFGRKSIPTIEVQMTIPSVGIIMAATIWGQLESKPDGTTVSFTAGAPKGVKFDSQEQKDRFLATAEIAASTWEGFDKATASATAKLLGTDAKPEAGVLQRPKLVKRIGMVTTPATPAA